MRVLFISEDRLKENSVIQKNVDTKLLTSVILQVQDINIQTTLGSGIYNEIKTQIQANTVTALNRTLLDEYIIPALIKYVESESCINLNFKITNANVNTPTPEHVQVIGIDEAFKLRAYFKDIAEWYATRLKEYLCENSTSYPLYNSPGAGTDVIHPIKENYNSGIYLVN
jgi:hypothetical protein